MTFNRFYKPILIGLLCFLIFFSILEISSRILVVKILKRIDNSSLVIDDQILHHVNRPSMKKGQMNGRSPYPFNTNKQGWLMEYDIELKKSEKTYRIFYVGDSTIQGNALTGCKMTDIVEKGLNQHFIKDGRAFEVITTGTGSYSFLLYYLLIKNKLLQYSPDLVVINIDMTDAVNDSYYRSLAEKDENGNVIAVRPKYTDRYVMTPTGFQKVNFNFYLPKWLVNHSDFFYLIDQIIRTRFVMSTASVAKSNANWLSHIWNKEIDYNVTESLKTLAQTIKILRENNIKVAVTGVPHYYQYTGLWSTHPHDVLKIFCEKVKVPYLNSYEALKKYIDKNPLDKYYVKDDPTHLNTDGQFIWADEQLKFLLDKSNNLL